MGRAERAAERVFKGVANHRRIEILRVLSGAGELSLREIADRVRVDYPTAGEHVRKLALSGLVSKRNKAQAVLHDLTPRGKRMLAVAREFLKT